jgi:NTP pyrophosphatase (non-canonical NTP hydrolase)
VSWQTLTNYQEFITELKKELGDCLWFIAGICYSQNISLEEIAIQNLAKLASRKERGVIDGNGDNR